MKNLVSLFLLLLLPAFMIAHGTLPASNDFSPTKITTNEAFTCNLPAPSGFMAITAAAGSVGLSWAAVPGAVDYQIQVYEVASGNWVSTHYTTNTYINIAPGAPQCYEFQVRAGCGSGTYSSNAAEDDACVDWVTEIVINGYQNCNQQATFFSNNTVVPGTSYNFSFTPGTRFRATITQNGTNLSNVIHFGLVVPNTTTQLMFSQGNSGPLTVGTLVTDYNPYCVPSGITATMYLTRCAEEIVRNLSMVATTQSNQATLSFSSLNGAFYGVLIETIQCEGKPREADDLPSATENNLTAAPNPFNDEINIMRDATSDLSENAHLQLYDLTGKIYFDQDFTGQDQVTLSSEGLPSGIYILRTRVGDKVQTQKLIKND